jgi:hypothetical protein
MIMRPIVLIALLVAVAFVAGCTQQSTTGGSQGAATTPATGGQTGAGAGTGTGAAGTGQPGTGEPAAVEPEPEPEQPAATLAACETDGCHNQDQSVCYKDLPEYGADYPTTYAKCIKDPEKNCLYWQVGTCDYGQVCAVGSCVAAQQSGESW